MYAGDFEGVYQVQRLQGGSLSVEELVSMATLGSAQVLGMEDRIGSLEVGQASGL